MEDDRDEVIIKRLSKSNKNLDFYNLYINCF